MKDFGHRKVKLKVTCRSCGRDRVIEGGVLPREFAPEDRLSQWRINQFAKRLICGNCGARWPTATLVVFE